MCSRVYYYLFAVVIVLYLFGSRSFYKVGEFIRVKRSYDYEGGDLETVKGGDVQCASRCSDNKQCVGFVSDSDTKVCQLKSVFGSVGKQVMKHNVFMRVDNPLNLKEV